MESRKEEHQALAEGGGTETRSGACYGGGGDCYLHKILPEISKLVSGASGIRKLAV